MTATRRLRAALAVTLTLLLALVGCGGGGAAAPSSSSSSSSQPSSSASPSATAAFLDDYVSGGRVVRRDQGGDTVSEGQAYAMLLAVADHDEATFRAVWRWTRTHLQRSDGLLSWRWADGEVADPTSAADADLDAARALVVAATTFSDPALRRQGVALGAAILDHETVATPHGRVLVAGSWATSGPPYAFDPSYVSPVAFTLLYEASGDPRWQGLSTGSRAAVDQATPDGELPPDWAEVAADGTASPAGGPSGEPVRFGYDAARTLVRYAESCDADDQAFARTAGAAIADDDPARATYELDGTPTTTDESPLSSVAQAATLARSGDADGARAALDRAAAESAATPTYYGDAWAALGPVLLEGDALGGCAALGR